ncbi:hypothetical protein, partial [Magnetococcus sp. PR-3]|uniref:hypothetical protein n=1 Tax=Magnetococcus sp. PR-3 TaxID=3120355 RepID=UPI002FCE5CC7
PSTTSAHPKYHLSTSPAHTSITLRFIVKKTDAFPILQNRQNKTCLTIFNYFLTFSLPVL